MNTKKDPENKNNEINLKRQLVETTEAVRQKFNSIKNDNIENRTTLERLYEPIMKPLNVLSSNATSKSPVLSPNHGTVQSTSNYPMSTPIGRKQSFGSVSSVNSDTSTLQDDMRTTLFETPSSSHIDSSDPDISPVMNESGEDVLMKHLNNIKSRNPAYDGTFGVRMDPITQKLKMGSLVVHFKDGNISFWDANKVKKYECAGSPELYDMIFLKNPQDVDNEETRQVYSKILKITNAPYKQYHLKNGFKNTNSKKFREVIKPLLDSRQYPIRSRSKIGGALKRVKMEKIYNSKPVNYVYWNSPKELVARLRLLVASKSAGHTGHDNEIISIIEELREEGIIY